MPRIVTLVLAALALVAGVVVTLTLTGREPETGTAPAAQEAPAPATGVQNSSTAASAEETFLEVTAAHLCATQATVYDDPADLAEAYRATPAYPGLDDAVVAAFQDRLAADAAFAELLTARVATTCG